MLIPKLPSFDTNSPKKPVLGYTKYRFLSQRAKLFWKLLEYRLTNKKHPIVANLFVTGACNLSCSYCYPGDDFSIDLSVDQWKTTIDKLYDMGVRFFAIAGGEPLIYKNVEALVDYLYEKNVICQMTTNGYLVRQKIDMIRKCSMLYISLDGNKEAHDFNRGKDSWEKAIDAIVYAREEGIPVRTNFTVTKNNLDQIDYMLDLAIKYDLTTTFTPLHEGGERGKEDTYENMWWQENEHTIQFFKTLKEKKKDPRYAKLITNGDFAMDYHINYPKPHHELIMKTDKEASYYTKPCSFGSFYFQVANNGDVYPCGILWNKTHLFTPKNIFRDGFEEAFDNCYDLKCQSCSFSNPVEWNEVATARWFMDGVKSSWHHAMSARIPT